LSGFSRFFATINHYATQIVLSAFNKEGGEVAISECAHEEYMPSAWWRSEIATSPFAYRTINDLRLELLRAGFKAAIS